MLRRPFSHAQEDADDDDDSWLQGGAGASEADVAATPLDEDEQDRLVERLRRESERAVWWVRAALTGLLAFVCALQCIVLQHAGRSRMWTQAGLILSTGASAFTLHTARAPPPPTPTTFHFSGAWAGGLSTLLLCALSLVRGHAAEDRLLGPALGLALVVLGRRWIAGLEEAVRQLERKKYPLRGA